MASFKIASIGFRVTAIFMANNFEEKQREREQAITRARWRKIFRRSLWTTIIIITFTGVVFIFIRFGRQGGSTPGVFVPDQGRDHVSLGTAFEYNSNPPTSGPHHVNDAEWGVYQEEIPDQILIHNLEHGGIWISYKPDIDPAAVAKLAAIAREYGRKVIMAPRPANDSDIALAAWNHLDKFSVAEFSEERVREFIKAYRNRGPEFVP